MHKHRYKLHRPLAPTSHVWWRCIECTDLRIRWKPTFYSDLTGLPWERWRNRQFNPERTQHA